MDMQMIAVMIFIIVLVAIVMGVAGDMYRNHLRYKSRGSSSETEALEQAARYAAKAEQLEARVRVLERIATDSGGDLAQQIEDLRTDSPLLERAG